MSNATLDVCLFKGEGQYNGKTVAFYPDTELGRTKAQLHKEDLELFWGNQAKVVIIRTPARIEIGTPWVMPDYDMREYGTACPYCYDEDDIEIREQCDYCDGIGYID